MRRFLMGVVLIGVALLATSCLFDQTPSAGQQQSDHTTVITTGGGDGAVWLLVGVLIVAAGWLLWAMMDHKARADRVEDHAAIAAALARGDTPVLNGRPYVPSDRLPWERMIGR